MAKMSKEDMAWQLKNAGWFRNYRYICDIVKDLSWQELKDYYVEMLDYKRNIR